MRLLAGWLGLLGAGVLVLSCDGSAGQLFSNEVNPLGAAGVGGFSGFAGRRGIGGAAGFAGRGGMGGGPGVVEGPGGDGGSDGKPGGGETSGDGETGDGGTGSDGEAGGDGECNADADCIDDNDCTLDRCEGAFCSHLPFAAGAECGESDDETCSAPDTCDGAGLCSPNDAPDDTPCEGGRCTLGECIPAEVEGCPAEIVTALPFEASWRTVGGVNLYDASCDVPNTPDFAVVFTAPASATYRFEAAGVVGTNDPETPGNSQASVLADSVLAVAVGACTGSNARQLACNDDARPNAVRDSLIDLALAEGDTVTVYAGEFSEVLPGGGSGTLSIRQLAD